MFTNSSPQKRKYSEYHDPDYRGYHLPEKSESKRAREEPSSSNSTCDAKPNKLQRVCELISREFQTEISFKQQQLEQIDERLSQARTLLDRLRYAIVAEYYKKQELPLSLADAAALRGNPTVYEDEPAGPQMPIHPSLKKIIGKKPRSYEEILRTCPKRAAAQNAEHTIRARTVAQRKEERRLQRLIRERGIVIDHSKQETMEHNATAGTVTPAPSIPNSTNNTCPKRSLQTPSLTGKALNATRLNNKTKHLIIVGNTSKYIGAEGDIEEKPFGGGQKMSHKWLIYVQSKDATIPLENYVKKVRFFLHTSYRPNDIVDISVPPFQIARRGWGEFPMRMQLYFHEHLQQKPVQLVHNLVLDKTQSGLQTLGAETLVEIWLRIEQPAVTVTVKQEITPKKIKQNNEVTVPVSPQEIYKKPRLLSFTNNKDELDDNFFEFLNKIETAHTSVCADIEKIQPTVMVSESLGTIVTSPCKMLRESPQKKSPKKQPPDFHSTLSINVAAATTTTTNNATTTPLAITTSNIQTATFVQSNHTSSVTATTPTLVNSTIVRSAASTNSSVFKVATTTTIAAPAVIKGVRIMRNNNSKMLVSATAPQSNQVLTRVNGVINNTLHKKLVKVVDSQGNVKYMQMLVAGNPPVQPKVMLHNAAAPKVINSFGNIINKANDVNAAYIRKPTNLVAVMAKSNNTVSTPPILQKPKPYRVPFGTAAPTQCNVFQKEGKLYIVDPVQMKLKQQQKKQVSLLKPQVSLLKPQPTKLQQTQQQPRSHLLDSVASDHDYAPAPVSYKTSTQNALNQAVNCSASVLSKPTPPPLHLGMRETKFKTSFNASNALERQSQQRRQLMQPFVKVDFASQRAAVEFLLRRLPLIMPKDGGPAVAFPFVYNTLQEFRALPTIKQRACEWLRAKCISKNLQSHSQLQRLHAAANDPFWTTREIVMFARYHAYTPFINATLFPSQTKTNQQFTDLVKSELVQQEQLSQHETLTSTTRIATWVDNMWLKIQQNEAADSTGQAIDVVGLQEASQTELAAIDSQPPLNPKKAGEIILLQPPARLQNATQLVSDICRDLGIRLKSEEICENVMQPLAQTALAQCLQVFVSKLLHQSVATNLQQHTQNGAPRENISTVLATDVGQAIKQSADFDFLTNRNFGITNFELSQVKSE